MSKTSTQYGKASQIPGQSNWNTSQNMVFGTVAEYIELQSTFVPLLNAYATFIKDKLDVDIKFGPALAKAESSADRKLLDASINQTPSRINDFVRIKGTIPNTGSGSVDDLLTVKEYIKQAAETLGYKDRFEFPEPETGFRDFKAHVVLTDPDDSSKTMTVEMLFEHEAMEAVNKSSAELRGMERRLREEDSGLKANYSKASTRITIAREGLRNARKDLHDTAAYNAGLDNLINPESNYISSHDGIGKTMSKFNGGLGCIRDQAQRVMNLAFAKT